MLCSTVRAAVTRSPTCLLGRLFPVDAEDLAARALSRGVRIVPLAPYDAHRPPENGLVIGYGAPSDLQLTRALDILLQLIDTTVPPDGKDRT